MMQSNIGFKSNSVMGDINKKSEGQLTRFEQMKKCMKYNFKNDRKKLMQSYQKKRYEKYSRELS